MRVITLAKIITLKYYQHLKKSKKKKFYIFDASKFVWRG